MGGIGAPELIIVLVVVLLLFGTTRLPKLARSVGQASKEFKKGVAEGPGDDEDEIERAKTEPKGLESKQVEPKDTKKRAST